MMDVVPSASAASGAVPPLGSAPRDAAALPDRLRELATEFEGIFLKSLLSRAFPSHGSGSLIPDGPGMAPARSMFIDALSQQISASGGGIGLSDAIVSSLISLQEGAQKSDR